MISLRSNQLNIQESLEGHRQVTVANRGNMWIQPRGTCHVGHVEVGVLQAKLTKSQASRRGWGRWLGAIGNMEKK